MPDLKDQNEIDAYYLADAMRPRAAGVMWTTLVELRVNKLFDAALRPDKSVYNELFQPSGALGSFGTKVRLAYLLGWIGKELYDDLNRLGKIRNRCAHVLEAKDFKDQTIASNLRNLTDFKFIPGMLEKAKREHESDPVAGHGARVLILTGMMEDPVSAFRFCVDLMIHRLDEIAETMKENLSKLPGHWLVMKGGAKEQGENGAT